MLSEDEADFLAGVASMTQLTELALVITSADGYWESESEGSQANALLLPHHMPWAEDGQDDGVGADVEDQGADEADDEDSDSEEEKQQQLNFFATFQVGCTPFFKLKFTSSEHLLRPCSSCDRDLL